MICHDDGTRDRRYTISREFCGHPCVQWVARFCGQWLGCSDTQIGALAIATKHQEARQRILEGLAS